MPTEYMMSPTTPALAALRRSINAYVRSTADLEPRGLVQVAAAIIEVDNNQIRYVYQRKFRRSRVLHLASLSKQFTGAAISYLVEHVPGFRLTDLVADHIGRWPRYADDVQIKHLLNHTSGLRAYAPVKLSHQAKSVVTQLRAMRTLKFTPGTQQRYCNSGYVALARVVEEVTGTDFPDFMQQTFFTPLRMNRTLMRRYNTVRHPSNTLTCYTRAPGRVPIPIPRFRADWIPGDGGVYSCVEDLHLWAKFLAGGSVLGSNIPARMFTPIPLDNGQQPTGNKTEGPYGFGLKVAERYGRPCVRHGGRWSGARNYSFFFPAHGTAPAVWVVALANCDQVKSRGIATRLCDFYFEED